MKEQARGKYWRPDGVIFKWDGGLQKVTVREGGWHLFISRILSPGFTFEVANQSEGEKMYLDWMEEHGFGNGPGRYKGRRVTLR